MTREFRRAGVKGERKRKRKGKGGDEQESEAEKPADRHTIPSHHVHAPEDRQRREPNHYIRRDIDRARDVEEGKDINASRSRLLPVPSRLYRHTLKHDREDAAEPHADDEYTC